MAKICFYGRLAETFGHECEVPLPREGCTVGELRALIAEISPAAKESILRPGVRAAIDDQFVVDDAVMTTGQRIEFMSPLSGG